ncbi:MAG: hypothetical protein MUO67_13295 [Anaerolineales bacterium]|nr:hypothetical protein [Anaerolineales bacterium]
MKKLTLFTLLVLIVISGLVFVGINTINAQSRTYALTRSVISSGGMGATAGPYTLTSTLGQPVAGSVSGGDFTLTSGFWGQALKVWFNNFLPLILR